MWSKTRQKTLLIRHKTVIDYGLEFGTAILRINEAGTIERWKADFDEFNRHFKLRERPQSISAILKNS